MFTVTAAASKDKPTDERDIVVPMDRGAAVRAVGTGLNDGFALGEPRNADVQKTAKEKPDKTACELEDSGGAHRKSIRFRRAYPM